jgi:hypothetical protein
MAQTQTEQARTLIDKIADAIEGIDDPDERYQAGRGLLIDEWGNVPRNVFVLETACAYLLARCQEEWE